MKGSSSRKLLFEDKNLNKQYWGQHLWARGYFVASSGNVTDEMIVMTSPKYFSIVFMRLFQSYPHKAFDY